MKKMLFLVLILTIGILNALDKAPDFRLEELDGNKMIKLQDLLKDNQYVILDFWATFCAPCKEEIPEIAKLDAKYENVTLAIVSTDKARKRSAAISWVKSKNLNVVSLFDADGSAQKLYTVTKLPTTYVIAPDGSVIYSHTSYNAGDEAKIEKAILDHIAKTKAGNK